MRRIAVLATALSLVAAPSANAAARLVVKGHGFGHGIGMSVIEAPGLFAGNTTELRPRMTVAYEPMVVVEGLGTGVVEDTLLITESGYERLTNYPLITWA